MPEPYTVTRFAPRGFAAGRPVSMPTLMLVEDSRYSSEVMRLYARALGLRLRRAPDLETAGGHLRLYRPDIVLIDLGLPDGRGEELVARLCAAQPRPPLIIATSGQSALRAGAMAAGADLFIEKPMPDIAQFRALLVEHYPAVLPLLAPPPQMPSPKPDPLALQDDLSFAARELEMNLDDRDGRIAASRTRYIAGLLDGVAGSLGDGALQQAARGQMAGDSRPCAMGNDAKSGAGAHNFNGSPAQNMPQCNAVEAPDQPGFRHLRDLVNERLRDIRAAREF